MWSPAFRSTCASSEDHLAAELNLPHVRAGQQRVDAAEVRRAEHRIRIGVVHVVEDIEDLDADLQRLVAAWRRQPDWLAAASYDGHIGVPAIFPVHAFPALLELRGDVGARPVLMRLADRCVRVAMPSAALDIDTPEDLRRLQAALHELSECRRLLDTTLHQNG